MAAGLTSARRSGSWTGAKSQATRQLQHERVRLDCRIAHLENVGATGRAQSGLEPWRAKNGMNSSGTTGSSDSNCARAPRSQRGVMPNRRWITSLSIAQSRCDRIPAQAKGNDCARSRHASAAPGRPSGADHSIRLDANHRAAAAKHSTFHGLNFPPFLPFAAVHRLGLI